MKRNEMRKIKQMVILVVVYFDPCELILIGLLLSKCDFQNKNMFLNNKHFKLTTNFKLDVMTQKNAF